MPRSADQAPSRRSRVLRGFGIVTSALALVGVGVAAGTHWGGGRTDRSRLAEMPVAVAQELLGECETIDDVFSLVAGQLSQVYDQLDFVRNAYHQASDDERAFALQRALEHISDYAAEHAKSIGQEPVEVVPEGK